MTDHRVRYGPHNPVETYVTHQIAEHVVDLGEIQMNYATVGDPASPALSDPDDLRLGCSVDGETVQDARTSDLIFSVPRLVAELSAVLPLLPGDVIFSGTPAGVGMARQPPRSLAPGQVLESWVDGVGTIRNHCVAR